MLMIYLGVVAFFALSFVLIMWVYQPPSVSGSFAVQTPKHQVMSDEFDVEAHKEDDFHDAVEEQVERFYDAPAGIRVEEALSECPIMYDAFKDPILITQTGRSYEKDLFRQTLEADNVRYYTDGITFVDSYTAGKVSVKLSRSDLTTRHVRPERFNERVMSECYKQGLIIDNRRLAQANMLLQDLSGDYLTSEVFGKMEQLLMCPRTNKRFVSPCVFVNDPEMVVEHSALKLQEQTSGLWVKDYSLKDLVEVFNAYQEPRGMDFH